MAKDVFSVPIFFIIFRETIEASIVISVLLSFVEQLVHGTAFNGTPDVQARKGRAMIKRMRIQIWAGAVIGLFIALAIGAAFIAVFYTKLNNLWQNTEALWEGIFSIVASLIILIMGLAFLRMDRSRAKWRIKLQAAFAEGQNGGRFGIKSPLSWFSRKDEPASVNDLRPTESEETVGLDSRARNEGRGVSQLLFWIPFITVLREGLEACIFVAGVSLSQPASATPLAVVIGILAGFAVGFLIYRGGSAFALHTFLIISTCILFLVGSGLFSKGVGYLVYYPWAKKVGGDVAESGDGNGSYDVTNHLVWHVNYGNPEIVDSGHGGWLIFNAILGWNNTATLGSILSYVFYWLTIAATLVYLKFKEGRTKIFGVTSKTFREREALRPSGAFDKKEKLAVATPEVVTPTEEHEKKLQRNNSGSGSSEDEAAPVQPLGRVVA